MVAWYIAFRLLLEPVVSNTSWQGVCDRAKLLNSRRPGSTQRGRGGGWQNILFKDIPPVTYFLELSPTS